MLIQEEQFLQSIETGKLPLSQFNHAAHVRLAWTYLKRYPLPEAIIFFRDTLKQFATRNGKAEIYHETITFAFLLLIYERINRKPTIADTWEDFVTDNQDIMTNGRRILLKWYYEETLSSVDAKTIFCLPDRWLRHSSKT